MRNDWDGASLPARPLYYSGVLFNWMFVWVALMALWVSMSNPSGLPVAVVAGLSLVAGTLFTVVRIRGCGIRERPDGVCVQRFFSGRLVAAANVVSVTHRTVRCMGGNGQIPVIHMFDERVVTVPSSCGVGRDVARLRQLLQLAPPNVPTFEGAMTADCECHEQMSRPIRRPQGHA